MRWIPQRGRPRRGAGRGSRMARVGAAACLATLLLSLGAPAPAIAYRCEDPPAGIAQQMFQECRVPDEGGRQSRPKKRGSMSSLTVLVLAVAAVLLIPIGARGIPVGIDPYRYDDESSK